MTTELDREIAALGGRLRAATVHIRSRDGAGSGVVWSANGLIVTNAHVVGSHALVELGDGRRFEGTTLARDPRRDLAVMRIAGLHLPTLQPRFSEPQPGELAFAFGHPAGTTNAVALGVIHSVQEHRGRRIILADVRLAPGNSGGPLVDHRGALLGINSMIAYGFAVAIPADDVSRFVVATGAKRAA